MIVNVTKKVSVTFVLLRIFQSFSYGFMCTYWRVLCALCLKTVHYQFERTFMIIRILYTFRNVSNVEYMSIIFDFPECISRMDVENIQMNLLKQDYFPSRLTV